MQLFPQSLWLKVGMEKDAWNNDSPTSAKGQEEQAAPESCCSASIRALSFRARAINKAAQC